MPLYKYKVDYYKEKYFPDNMKLILIKINY